MDWNENETNEWFDDGMVKSMWFSQVVCAMYDVRAVAFSFNCMNKFSMKFVWNIKNCNHMVADDDDDDVRIVYAVRAHTFVA